MQVITFVLLNDGATTAVHQSRPQTEEVACLFSAALHPRHLVSPAGYTCLILAALTSSNHSSTAVAARFGIGLDFWLNLLLTICGYIPGTYPSIVHSAVC